MTMVLESRSADETQRLGEALGRVLEPGDVVSLVGALGAGKTCFVQGLARGLGVPADRRVQSPTFTLVNEHLGRVPLYHIDLYRLENETELREIGVDEYLEGGGVAAVEWFDRFPALRPAELLEIALAIGDDERRTLSASARGPRAEARLQAWQKEIA